MIHISFILLGAVISALLGFAILGIWTIQDVSLYAKTVTTIACILITIMLWCRINNEWNWWTERARICCPNGEFADSLECQEFEDKK